MSTIIVLVPGHYAPASVHFTATTWTVSDTGQLTVYAGRAQAAKFPPGHWAAVIDDQHRQPDMGAGALLAAQRALRQIAEGIRDGWLTDPRKIERIAADGLMEGIVT